MRNFIIVFQEREGSSAIIEYFANHPQVNVPLFEELDWYLRSDIPGGHIPQVLEDLYRYKNLRCALGEWKKDGVVVDNWQVEKRGIMGFKWRIWGEPDRLAPILLRHGVIVYHLVRQDLCAYGMSSYINSVVAPLLPEARDVGLQQGDHVQFILESRKDQFTEKLRQAIREAIVDVDVDAFLGIIKTYADHKLLVEHKYMDLFRQSGVQVKCVYYEDFAANREAFLARMVREIGIAEIGVKRSRFEKIGRASPLSQASNKDRILADHRVMDTIGRYAARFGGRSDSSE